MGKFISGQVHQWASSLMGKFLLMGKLIHGQVLANGHVLAHGSGPKRRAPPFVEKVEGRVLCGLVCGSWVFEGGTGKFTLPLLRVSNQIIRDAFFCVFVVIVYGF